jgi:hypothetical protein
MKKYIHPAHPHVTVFEVPKKQLEHIDLALCKEPKETLKAYYKRQEKKPDLLSNGGFYHLASGETCFNLIDEGKVISGWHWYNMGMGIVDGELKYGNVSEEKWTDFVSAYPPLVADSKALPITFATEIAGKNKRKVLAYNDKAVFLIEIWSPGMRFPEMQDMLLEMGVTHAINLDGGESVLTLEDGIEVNSPKGTYRRPVDNVVAMFLKDLKRIQVGAWKKNKLYAIAMQARIKLLPDPLKAGYKNARLVYVDGWWKVQVGAFYDDDGVQRVVDDLATHGITDVFIQREES